MKKTIVKGATVRIAEPRARLGATVWVWNYRTSGRWEAGTLSRAEFSLGQHQRRTGDALQGSWSYRVALVRRNRHGCYMHLTVGDDHIRMREGQG